ncbi:bifunctional lysylphosphatidylglycerol synthetase/lysine--tRNA ligase LysX [Gordonia sp. HY442]|uniref:bifunctional lysylphosphatidylglycerol synthetase/lysine--tRNA ligase LysX n=1 Tax=Gordonia zhenghanii TaxID=2911516 RepID=UPI001F012F42|nr:bifunctional lysylphosphatidylglycerol synthetase/lysine--tRNA ligase LysX [Gordonia zhenghanii]MCF8603520.1 bifunctional lysylphosphatidylglycerol synthetase/lysine--tRNA ligase LysX [Gordonia zhenghanii]
MPDARALRTPADLTAREAGRRATQVRRARSALDRISHPQGLGHTVPSRIAAVVGVLATVALSSVIIPPLHRLIRVPQRYVDGHLFPMPSTSLAWAVTLALLAVALGQRKRIAWWITVGILSSSATVNLLVVLVAGLGKRYYDDRVPSAIGLVIDVAVLIVLLVAYRQFSTRVRRGAVPASLAVLIGGLVIGTAAGWALVALDADGLRSGERLPYAFNHVVAFSSLTLHKVGDHQPDRTLEWLLGLFGAVALIAAAIVLFRSQRLASFMTAPDERLIRALISTYGDDDSLAYFSTRRDKAVVFAADGRAAITYRVELSTAVAGGDPIGAPASWPDAIAEFMALAERYGWRPAALGVSAVGAQAFTDAGLTALTIGDEAIVNVADYSLSGPEMKSVRGSVSHVKRLGVIVRTRRFGELTTEETAQVRRRADDWRDTEDERGFAMALSRVGDVADGDCLLVEAVEQAGAEDEKVIGMLGFVPWGRTGASLDVMRRDRRGPNGVVETMVSEFARDAGIFGITRVSLNFATFRGVFEKGEEIGSSPTTKAMYGLLTFFSRYYQMESLYRSNAKYGPDWVPRYVCYEDGRSIPRVGLASVVAEGFVRLPGAARRERHYTRGESSIPDGVDIDQLVAEMAADASATTIPAVHRPEQVKVRLAKLQRLVDEGIDPYPVAQAPTHTVADAAAAPAGTRVRVAGRVVALRDFGSVVFAQCRDWSGDIQLLVARSIVVRALRDHLSDNGFLEVETPILQPVHGGANAAPFRTHINAYDLDLYLRIAPELYLKRLCAGGVEKVFEIGRNFRNEGVDFSHNPEFTSLEAYAAHQDYESMMTMTRSMIIAAATAVHDAPIIERTTGDGVRRIDLSVPWPVVTVHDAVSQACDAAVTASSTVDELRDLCRAHDIAFRPDWDSGHLVLELYERLVDERTEFPTFYKDFPTSTSPLTRAHRSVEGVAERWDLVAWGVELGIAYTELTDPVEQRSRLTRQSMKAAGGDADAMELDEDFLTALEYAMPPTGGLGIGVDRVVMLITGRSIRESLAFGLVKPR